MHVHQSFAFVSRHRSIHRLFNKLSALACAASALLGVACSTSGASGGDFAATSPLTVTDYVALDRAQTEEIASRSRDRSRRDDDRRERESDRRDSDPGRDAAPRGNDIDRSLDAHGIPDGAREGRISPEANEAERRARELATSSGLTVREREELSNYYTKEGNQRYIAQEYAAALRLLDYALELNPSNVSASSLKASIYGDIGVGGSIYRSTADEGEARRMEAVNTVRERVRRAQELLAEERYTEAIETAEAAVDVVRWSGYLIEDDHAYAEAQQLIEEARRRRDESRLRDAARIKEEQRRLQVLQAQAKLDQYRGEIRNLFSEAKNLFDRREYGESVIKLDQILRNDPFNQDVIELKRIAVTLNQSSTRKDDHERFRQEWNRSLMLVERNMFLPTDDIIFPSAEHVKNVENRARHLESQQTELVAKGDVSVFAALESVLVDLVYESETTFGEVVANLRKQARVSIVVHNSVTSLQNPMSTTARDLRAIPLKQALAQVKSDLSDGIIFYVQHGAIIINSSGNAQSTSGGHRRTFNVADIMLNLRNFRAREPRLPEDQNAPETRFPNDDENDPDPPEIDAELLRETITLLVAPDTWGGNPWPDPNIPEGTSTMTITHTLETVQRVEQLLADLRRSQGLEVAIDTRFITIRDDFLEDIGLDFRDIGGSPQGANPSPVPAALDDVEFGTNAIPVGSGTNNAAGFFFQDFTSPTAVSHDMRARVENLFDQAVGGRHAGFGLTNFGGASFQFAFVDNPEINAVLRAVKKKDRATLLQAPSVTVHNTQRGHVSMMTEINYISDFAPEVNAGTTAASPVIDVISDGIVLDVRPTVSADRRYITLELRPTLATLIRPIAEIETSLGTGPPVKIQTPELQLQRVRTTITVPDGGSFMMGGLRRMSERDFESGVPVLSDIPLLGWLFSRRAISVIKQDVVIIVSARIIALEEEFERHGYYSSGGD